MTTLRDYQARAVAEVCASRVPAVLVAPTGAGKTAIGVAVVAALGGRALWVAHRRELIDQAVAALARVGVEAGVILAGRPERRELPIQVGSVQTLARRDVPGCDALVLDEAHHACANSYGDLIEGRGDAFLLGLTATPYRLDGQGLGRAGFERIVVAATVADLCQDGWLVEPDVYAFPAPAARATLRKRAGEFAAEGLTEISRTVELRGRVVEEWGRRAAGRPTVVFAVDVAHARDLAERFVGAGVRAGMVDGTTPKEERAATLAALASGDLTVLVNVGILTEGWDLPRLEVAVLARPTASRCLHRQMLGRIMRACEGKTGALVLDLAGNVEAHGLPTDPDEATLEDGVLERKAEATGRTCPACRLVNTPGATACAGCGYVWPRTRVEVVEPGDAASGAQRARAALDPFPVRARLYARMAAKAKARGWKPGAPAAWYRDRYGSWPTVLGDALVDEADGSPENLARLRAAWQEAGERIARAKGREPVGFARWFARTREREWEACRTG